MINRDLILALLLPLPPLLGFWVFRLKGRVGLSYGYFLGGTLLALAAPWSLLTGRPQPTAELGGALFGFSLFLQAHREGRQGIRRMVVGVAGATLFAWGIGFAAKVSMASLGVFWGIGLLVALIWLLLSDLGYRLARGRYLGLRLPVVGALTLLASTLLHRVLPLGSPALSWPASLLAGALLGAVALQQLHWLRQQGLWVEGRGDGFRVALSALEGRLPAEGQPLSYRIDALQPILLLDDRGLILEANEAFSRLVGIQRHQIRGFDLQGVFQGRDRGVWDSLRQQLLREAHGAATATLVRSDSSFEEVMLEAVAFDRNMALVWVSDPATGTLAVRSRGQGPALHGAGAGPERAANAVGSLLAATERLLAEAGTPELRASAELARASALRLSAIHGNARLASSQAPIHGKAVIEAFLPRIRRILPEGTPVTVFTKDLELLVDGEAMERILMHLALHAAHPGGGSLDIRLAPVSLGGRPWGLLELRSARTAYRGPDPFVGLSWLQRVVSESRGMLELAEEEGGLQLPRVYLPVAESAPPLEAAPLLGRSVWIVESDPLLREALGGLVLGNGGRVELFPDLRALLRASRLHPLPDVAVVERTSRLDRFHRALRQVRKEPLPALVLGNGDLIPAQSVDAGLPLVGFLEKPFFGQELVQSLLALLSSAGRAG